LDFSIRRNVEIGQARNDETSTGLSPSPIDAIKSLFEDNKLDLASRQVGAIFLFFKSRRIRYAGKKGKKREKRE
jgi:hypothetical protein